MSCGQWSWRVGSRRGAPGAGPPGTPSAGRAARRSSRSRCAGRPLRARTTPGHTPRRGSHRGSAAMWRGARRAMRRDRRTASRGRWWPRREGRSGRAPGMSARPDRVGDQATRVGSIQWMIATTTPTAAVMLATARPAKTHQNPATCSAIARSRAEIRRAEVLGEREREGESRERHGHHEQGQHRDAADDDGGDDRERFAMLGGRKGLRGPAGHLSAPWEPSGHPGGIHRRSTPASRSQRGSASEQTRNCGEGPPWSLPPHRADVGPAQSARWPSSALRVGARTQTT